MRFLTHASECCADFGGSLQSGLNVSGDASTPNVLDKVGLLKKPRRLIARSPEQQRSAEVCQRSGNTSSACRPVASSAFISRRRTIKAAESAPGILRASAAVLMALA